jgi:uncharacterized protein (AIM24 family)
VEVWSESASQLSQSVTLQLEEGESVHILHPRQIISFQGNPSHREDRLMDITGMYRKRKLIQSQIRGSAQLMIGLPAGYSMQTIPIQDDSDLLFEWKHVLFYTEGMRVERKVQTLKNAIITRELVKMKFSSHDGQLGILSHGPLHRIELHPEFPTYIDVGCLVAYPENAKLTPRVYGNTLASQHMNYHWEIMGHGYALVQTGKSDSQLEQDIEGDGFIKRILREVIPFGGIIIK